VNAVFFTNALNGGELCLQRAFSAKGAVIGNGKTVRLVAQLLKQLQGRRGFWQIEGVGVKG